MKIKEKLFIEVGGILQGMFLQSEDSHRPVLLFLHGGPGSPETAYTQSHPMGIEKLFTVCWWEQRGSGISYERDTPKKDMTVEQIIFDTIDVTNYLRERFHKEKIYIMGHSWGSLLGLLTAERRPDLYHAFIGLGQVVWQAESERIAYRYMLKEFNKQGNEEMVEALNKFPVLKVEKSSRQYLGIRGTAMEMLGIGSVHKVGTNPSHSKILEEFKGYTAKEKKDFYRANLFSIKCLWDQVLEYNLLHKPPKIKIPVYILHGKYDYQVSYDLARKFAIELTAPIKGFYTFAHSAHSIGLEEPEKMCKILREDVLKDTTALGDRL